MKAAVATVGSALSSTAAEKCRRKFLRFFPKGFHDERYWAWERGYKWAAHERWMALLDEAEFATLLDRRDFAEIGSRALRTLSGTNLIFSFESMALRDALKEKRDRVFLPGVFTSSSMAVALSKRSLTPGSRRSPPCRRNSPAS